MDIGGKFREWVYLFIMEVVNIKLLIPFISKGNTYYRLNPSNSKPTYYAALGKVLAKSIMEKVPLNINLCKPLCLQIIGKPITIDSIEQFDYEVLKSSDIQKPNFY